MKRGLQTTSISTAATPYDSAAFGIDSAITTRLFVNLGRAAVPDSAFRIVDSDGNEVAENSIGHVELRSPCLLDGYVDTSRRFEPHPAGDWLRTGDIGFIQGEDLYFVGRAKELIVINGRKLVPADIDHEVATKLGVRQARVASVGVPGRFSTEAIAIALEARTPLSDPHRILVSDACFDLTGVRPAAIVQLPIGAIPKTSSGKVQRSRLRQIVLQLDSSVRLASFA